MNISDHLKGALDVFRSEVSEAVVAVSYKGQTVTNAIRSSRNSQGSISVNGDQGNTTNLVYVDAADMAKPPDGATMLVNGDTVEVISAVLDPTETFLKISYIVTRPNTEGA